MAQQQEYSDEAREFINKEVSHLIKDKGMSQKQAVAAAHDIAKRKGMKVPEKD